MTVDILLLDPEITAYLAECAERKGYVPPDAARKAQVEDLVCRKKPLRWSHHSLRLGDWVSTQLEIRYKAAEARGEDVSTLLPGVWTSAVFTKSDSEYLYECALRDLQQMEREFRAAWNELQAAEGLHVHRPSYEGVLGEKRAALRHILERFLGVLLEALYHNLDMDFGGM